MSSSMSNTDVFQPAHSSGNESSGSSKATARRHPSASGSARAGRRAGQTTTSSRLRKCPSRYSWASTTTSGPASTPAHPRISPIRTTRRPITPKRVGTVSTPGIPTTATSGSARLQWVLWSEWGLATMASGPPLSSTWSGSSAAAS